MVEESPESFVARWRRHAAEVELFARTEGSPLLECRAGETILQLFERTGPYLAHPGAAEVIINPVVEELRHVGEDEAGGQPALESIGLSRVRLSGTVTEREGHTLVVDAGVPLVVSSLEPLPDAMVPGVRVLVTSQSPVHAFVVTDHLPALRRRHESHDDQL